jgi:hypothetical protein
VFPVKYELILIYYLEEIPSLKGLIGIANSPVLG